MIARCLAFIRQRRAMRRLAEMTKANRESFETRLYVKNRQAQIKRRAPRKFVEERAR